MNWIQGAPSSPSGGRKATKAVSSKISASNPRRSRNGAWRTENVMRPCGLENGENKSRKAESRHNLCDDSRRLYTGEFLLQPLEGVIELAMIKTHGVEDGRMKIANLYRVLRDLITHRVALAVAHAW